MAIFARVGAIVDASFLKFRLDDGSRLQVTPQGTRYATIAGFETDAKDGVSMEMWETV